MPAAKLELETPLEPVQAYLYFRRFGILPRAGGTFDQDPLLLEELELVAEIVEEAENAARSQSR